MPEAGTEVAPIYPSFRKKRLPRIGVGRVLNLQNRREECVVVLLDNGEERCVSPNVSNFGIKLAERIIAGNI